MSHGSIPFEPDLANGEIGCLVDDVLIDSRHPDGLILSTDQWAALRQQRQDAGRPLHWWELAFHG
ncbi:hypothetical protein [Stenotrophomonas bentonitica]